MSLYLVFSDRTKRVEKRIPAGKEAGERLKRNPEVLRKIEQICMGVK